MWLRVLYLWASLNCPYYDLQTVYVCYNQFLSIAVITPVTFLCMLRASIMLEYKSSDTSLLEMTFFIELFYSSLRKLFVPYSAVSRQFELQFAKIDMLLFIRNMSVNYFFTYECNAYANIKNQRSDCIYKSCGVATF